MPDFDQLWDYDHPAETEQKFRALLDSAQASGSPSYYAQLLTQLARTQSLQRKFAEAHQILDEVHGLLNGKTVTAHIRYLLERGRAFNSAKQVEQARPLFLQAWEMAGAAGEDFYAVDAAHMLGICESREEQLAWNYKALTAAEKSTDPKARGWLGSLYNNMGWTEHDAGKFSEALELFEKALKFRAEQGQEKQRRIAQWCVARCLRSLDRVTEALALQQELEALGDNDGYVFEELGECLLLLGRERESTSYFAKAYELLSKDSYLVENESSRLPRLKTLGNA
jgi:tetratricopeptide (TPR) repeat protein